MRIFFANGRFDYQWTPNIYNIFMSTYNSLTIRAFSSLFPEDELNTLQSSSHFLYRNDIDRLTYCLDNVSFPNHMKVYFIFEDLL